MKLYDCCMYFDEDLVLDLRFNILNNYVDKFVVAEATKNHAGKDKKLNFNINNFHKFRNKITYIIVEDMPMNLKYYKKNWPVNHLRDQHQRNALTKGYKDCDDNDLIMISDIDEIPDPNKIKQFEIKNKYACFIQKNFQSKLNLLNITDNNWMGTKICKKKYLKSPQWLRDQKIKNYPFWRFLKIKWNIIENGGWHFSFLMSPENIQKKLKSYAHAEFNKANYTNLDKIKNSIENKTDLFDRKLNFEKIEINNNFPKFIVDNKELYKNWII